jgi:hypothetical protein
MAYDMNLSAKKTFCVRPQVNMATGPVRMKDTEKQSSRLESKTNTELNNGMTREWKIT